MAQKIKDKESLDTNTNRSSGREGSQITLEEKQDRRHRNYVNNCLVSAILECGVYAVESCLFLFSGFLLPVPPRL